MKPLLMYVTQDGLQNWKRLVKICIIIFAGNILIPNILEMERKEAH